MLGQLMCTPVSGRECHNVPYGIPIFYWLHSRVLFVYHMIAILTGAGGWCKSCSCTCIAQADCLMLLKGDGCSLGCARIHACDLKHEMKCICSVAIVLPSSQYTGSLTYCGTFEAWIIHDEPRPSVYLSNVCAGVAC